MIRYGSHKAINFTLSLVRETETLVLVLLFLSSGSTTLCFQALSLWRWRSTGHSLRTMNSPRSCFFECQSRCLWGFAKPKNPFTVTSRHRSAASGTQNTRLPPTVGEAQLV